MRCHICNRMIDNPEWDEVTGTWHPCRRCREDIEGTVKDYGQRHTLGDLFDWEEGAESLPPEEGLEDYYHPL